MDPLYGKLTGLDSVITNNNKQDEDEVSERGKEDEDDISEEDENSDEEGEHKQGSVSLKGMTKE